MIYYDLSASAVLRLPLGSIASGMRFRCVWLYKCGVCAFLLMAAIRVLAVQEIDTDVCVYGGTSGGVIAAVQAARMGKSVALVVVNNHLGGMTSGGLGQTDVGNFGDSYIQGVAREFYTRVGQKYGTGATFAFEPHIAEMVFDEMVQQSGVVVYTNQYLVSATKSGRKIVLISMNNGNVFRAKVFIDASYEGDLMAKAGISYTIGRESTNQYNESLNGICIPNSGGHQFGTVNVDPYVVPGNPASGLLPLVQSAPAGVPGASDQRVPAYGFRMCLTQNSTNRLSISAPTNYNPSQYELLGRYLQAKAVHGASLTLDSLMIISTMPNGKTDINNYGPVSTDFIGQSYGYPEADYATRQQIWQAHKNYAQGLFYFLSTDSRVPAAVQSQMNAYGLCKDEFTDNDGWPYQLYVRESRRMISDYILTQSNCLGLLTVTDSVGLAAYTMDSHNCQRCVVNGYAENEGDVETSIPGPFQIPYRVLVPKISECNNLLVPWCISSSHIAFSSFRMEPVFMIAAQAAGTAACMAIDDSLSVQNINLERLQAQLLADGQLLQWTNSVPTNGIIVDNAAGSGVQIVGSWTGSSATAGYYGTNYLHDGNINKGSSSVKFTPTLAQSGSYQVYARWTSFSNRATNVPIDIIFSGGTNTVYVDQTQRGGQWVWLLTANFNAGTGGSVTIRNNNTVGYVIADAIEFVSNGLPVVNLWARNAQSSRVGPQPASITVSRESCTTNSAITIYLNLDGTARNEVDYQYINNSLTMPAGVSVTNFYLIPVTNAYPVGNRIALISLSNTPTYYTGMLNNAAIQVNDSPINNWRLKYFGADSTNIYVAGDSASPTGDGVPNLVKYALGLNPTNYINNSQMLSLLNTNGFFNFSYIRPDPPPSDIAYGMSASSNLIDWTTNMLITNESLAFDANFNNATVIVRELVPANAAPRNFFRMWILRR